MNLAAILGELRSMNGYRCAGLIDVRGELLIQDSADSAVDLEVTAITFNDIFRGAHEAANKVGLEATTEMQLNTPNGVIVMMCSGVNSNPHIHLITVLEKGGNPGLTKTTMHKIIPKFLKELS